MRGNEETFLFPLSPTHEADTHSSPNLTADFNFFCSGEIWAEKIKIDGHNSDEV